MKEETENIDKGEISDGYHTFNELYEHRITLYIALCKMQARQWAVNNDRREWSDEESPAKVWMTEKHSDETSFDGWFVLGINREKGKQITYHLPMSKWDECMIFAKILEKAPDFDGHTSNDVLERIKKL